MTLQDAIRKAGPGGKGTNEQTDLDFEISEHGVITWAPRLPQTKDFDSSFWEVAEPDIQVGDIVSVLSCTPTECEVLKVLKGHATLWHRGLNESTPCVCGKMVSALIFSSRPDKPVEHVFEGMEVVTDSQCSYITIRTVENVPARYPWASLHSNGKTYTMILREV